MMDLKKKKRTKFLDVNKSYHIHLSIQLSLDGFSFSTLDIDQKKVLQVTHVKYEQFASTPELLLENVKKVFSKEKALQKRYASVNITHVNDLSVLVPKPLFDENKIKDYIKYSSKTFEQDYVVHDEIEDHEMINVYIPFVNVNNFFLERFGGFEYKHFSSVLIDSLLKTYQYSQHPHLFAYVHDRHFEIVAIAGNQFLLYNSFLYDTKEDFIYYILFAAEQLKFDTNQMELMLLGDISTESELYKTAFAYVKKVSLLENRSAFSFEKNISEKEKRRYFTLLNQY